MGYSKDLLSLSPSSGLCKGISGRDARTSGGCPRLVVAQRMVLGAGLSPSYRALSGCPPTCSAHSMHDGKVFISEG